MKTRSEEITEILRKKILDGELQPGAHLEELPLANLLEVSRTPIRAALATLAQEGLLEYVPKRGHLVRSFGSAEVANAYEVRATLEGLACRLAAKSPIDPKILRALSDCLATGDEVLAKGWLDPNDLDRYREMNVAFHETILGLSGNAMLVSLVRQTYNTPLASDRVMLWTDYGVIRRSHDDHHRILDALRRGDSLRAEALMREHIYYSGTFMVAECSPPARTVPASMPQSTTHATQPAGSQPLAHAAATSV